MEEWRSIKDYEGLYEISNLSRVKSLEKMVVAAHNSRQLRKERILSTSVKKTGYLYVDLSKDNNNSRFYIHRLVYQAFNGDLNDNLQIDHIDHDKMNNAPENLQQISHRKNSSKDKWRKGKTSIYTGVSLTKSNRWFSKIQVNGIDIALGTFDSELEAAQAYQNKLQQIKADL